MHYIPHQRSLPPIPMTSSQGTPWQRTSLPVRSRARSPTHSWNRSSLPFHPRRRPASYYHPEEHYRFSSHSRSSSSHDLHERSLNSYQSLDRRMFGARSSHDIPRHIDLDRNIGFAPYRHHSPDDERPQFRRQHYFDDIRDPIVNNFDPYRIHPDPYRRDYSPRFYHSRSLPSRHGSADEMDSPLHSMPPSPRSKTSSYRRDSPMYDGKSLGSKSSFKNNYNNHCLRPNSFHESFSTSSKLNQPRETKYVYLKQPTPQHCTQVKITSKASKKKAKNMFVFSQVLATLVVSLGPFCAGLGKGYSSPALASMAALSAQGHHFAISKDQGSWVASLSLLGAFFGSLPAGMSVNWGRKKVLCVIAIPFALSWVMTVLASNVYMLYAASILGGICTAIISVVTPIYISEIAHPDIRGCLCSFSKMNSNVGMLISYLLGAFMNWRQLATVTAIAPACLFVCSLLIPETPSFLLYTGERIK